MSQPDSTEYVGLHLMEITLHGTKETVWICTANKAAVRDTIFFRLGPRMLQCVRPLAQETNRFDLWMQIGDMVFAPLRQHTKPPYLPFVASEYGIGPEELPARLPELVNLMLNDLHASLQQWDSSVMVAAVKAAHHYRSHPEEWRALQQR